MKRKYKRKTRELTVAEQEELAEHRAFFKKMNLINEIANKTGSCPRDVEQELYHPR